MRQGSLYAYSANGPSGIDLLDNPPEHWEVRPLKHWVTINAISLPENTDPDFEFRYLEIGSVGTGVLVGEAEILRFAAAPSRARRVVRTGDTILSTVRTYLKATWFASRVTDDLICSTGFAVLTPGRAVYPKFLSYLVQSDSFAARVTAESVGTAYPAITEARLGSFHVALPPFSDQVVLVERLDKATLSINIATERAQLQMHLFEEYHTRLIDDVVTGKIEVSRSSGDKMHTPGTGEFSDTPSFILMNTYVDKDDGR